MLDEPRIRRSIVSQEKEFEVIPQRDSYDWETGTERKHWEESQKVGQDSHRKNIGHS